jgi:uracil-DNA glycosylase
MNTETAKSLASTDERALWRVHLSGPHIAPLTELIDRIRRERRCGSAVPYCDPADGGVHAECLLLLEAPGPKAVESGFVSRNNPDESAKNFLELNRAAGLPRTKTVTWNIVPWYLGASGRIRPANPTDIDEGWPYLLFLLGLLPSLRVGVLVGRKAQKVKRRLVQARPDLRLLDCPHPSPLVVNRSPGNRALIQRVLHDAVDALEITARESH